MNLYIAKELMKIHGVINSQIFDKYGYESYKTISNVILKKYFEDIQTHELNSASLESRELTRHISLIFKHNGLAKRFDVENCRPQKAKIIEICQYLFESISKYHWTYSKFDKCMSNDYKKSEIEDDTGNTTTILRKKSTWLEDGVHFLSTLSHLKEGVRRDVKYGDSSIKKNGIRAVGIKTSNMGRLPFDCIFFHGTQLLNKVSLFQIFGQIQ